MKLKLIALLCALLAAAGLRAQMMPDSTVRIIARWEVGDRMDYTLLERSYSFDADHNETRISSSSRTLRFEVVAETDSTYTLVLRQDDLPDPGDEAPLLFKTTRQGVLLDAEKATSKIFLDDVAPLFFFHGARLDTARVYSCEQEITGIPGDITLTLPATFRVDPELSDDYSVVLRMEAEGTDGPAGIKQYITEEIQLGSGWPVQWVFDRYVEISQGEQFQGMHVTREIFPEDKIGGE